jgi:hypothetical protein
LEHRFHRSNLAEPKGKAPGAPTTT